MKKHVLLLILLFSSLISFPQKAAQNGFSIKEFIKAQKAKGDTIWLPHYYTIYKIVNEEEYETFFKVILEYYPGTANIESEIFVKQDNDTLRKFIFYYDDMNRIISTIIQDYTGIQGYTWRNKNKIDQFYNQSGWDSLYLNYKWSNGDTIWKKKSLRGITYYDNYGEAFIYKDSTCGWNGNNWILIDGNRRDYSFNEFGQVNDLKASFFRNNQWEYDFRIQYFLCNDTTGLFDKKITYVWNNGQWQNYFRFTEIVIHNWHGFGNYGTDIEYEHKVREWWNGNEWVYILKRNNYYDSLGSNIHYRYYWINNNWQLTGRSSEIHNDRNLITLVQGEEYSNNEWDTIWGSRYSFEYLGPIWKVMQLEEYDTLLTKWVHTYDHVLSDFSFVLNTPEVKADKKANGLKVIPNPVKNIMFLQPEDKTDKIKTVNIYTITGNRVFEKTFRGSPQQANIDVSALKNGIYVLNVITKQGNRLQKKFMKE